MSKARGKGDEASRPSAAGYAESCTPSKMSQVTGHARRTVCSLIRRYCCRGRLAGCCGGMSWLLLCGWRSRVVLLRLLNHSRCMAGSLGSTSLLQLR